jgi:hypothetical protein
VATILVLLGLEPIGLRLPDIAAAALLAAICIALLVIELVVLRRSRDAPHAAVRRERAAHEARETEWRRDRHQ